MFLLGCAAIAQGCGGSEASVTPASTNNASNDGGDEDGSPTSGDASSDDGGEAVTDGGSNIDPDAGDPSDDAGTDGGPCNTLANEGQAVTSTCASVRPPTHGGALVGGTYLLESVVALGAPNFCQNQFLPTGFRETLALTVDGAGVGTVQTVARIANTGTHHRTFTLAPGAGGTSPASNTGTCPVSAAAPLPYNSETRLNKQVLELLQPYGKSLAIYRFVKK
ncbi:hypothetical protein AKJ09_05682 [Labilithrix luteola]|uniref:Uncharacterized protein n=1 Tax=Labilithrix luteola TaxID=1391654 RepID=A0A0K1PZR6_9BACT|nr:hypothetical protein AKJ09_05682 [Labilithrix luteola]